ncbi:MAG: hypothetical protein B6I20_12020 [Bacteroidetes bacterium 4572_117]|nr:MAG: hypothetical protein B6I20_12020 [Bacteroidetes bacterium 4572_117]
MTLGAVGKATTIEYIEVIANKDDGVEFFGGCPQLKYIIVSGCGDDSFDYDEGFHGKGQFWCTIQSNDGDRMGEHDGGPSDNETGLPYAIPIIFNATYIGNGSGRVITFRDNAGGTYANSIFANQAKGIDIEYLEDAGTMVGCSYKMFRDGYLNIENNVFDNVAGVTPTISGYNEDLFKVTVPDAGVYQIPPDLLSGWVHTFEGNSNSVANVGVSAANPVPANAQTNDLAITTDPFFTSANYKGAFNNTNWAKGWTLLFK